MTTAQDYLNAFAVAGDITTAAGYALQTHKVQTLKPQHVTYELCHRRIFERLITCSYRLSCTRHSWRQVWCLASGPQCLLRVATILRQAWTRCWPPASRSELHVVRHDADVCVPLNTPVPVPMHLRLASGHVHGRGSAAAATHSPSPESPGSCAARQCRAASRPCRGGQPAAAVHARCGSASGGGGAGQPAQPADDMPGR